jgi:hypothetical protein
LKGLNLALYGFSSFFELEILSSFSSRDCLFLGFFFNDLFFFSRDASYVKVVFFNLNFFFISS